MNWLNVKKEMLTALIILICCIIGASIFTFAMTWWFR